MTEHESWENKCCRCEGDTQVDLHPGKRACHLTCGPCLYPEDWSKCASCEIVGHCTYALQHLKSLKTDGIQKGCYFNNQLTGEETVYHTLTFVDAEQYLTNKLGEKNYVKYLKRANSKSPCL